METKNRDWKPTSIKHETRRPGPEINPHGDMETTFDMKTMLFPYHREEGSPTRNVVFHVSYPKGSQTLFSVFLSHGTLAATVLLHYSNMTFRLWKKKSNESNSLSVFIPTWVNLDLNSGCLAWMWVFFLYCTTMGNLVQISPHETIQLNPNNVREQPTMKATCIGISRTKLSKHFPFLVISPTLFLPSTQCANGHQVNVGPCTAVHGHTVADVGAMAFAYWVQMLHVCNVLTSKRCHIIGSMRNTPVITMIPIMLHFFCSAVQFLRQTTGCMV